jgi:tRNA dimethylallyltransferase
LKMAQRLGGEIVSCDSVAIFREFEIGTAKPDATERLLAPHHLLDVASPTESFSAGDYARLARLALNQIASRGHLPIVVGGTGLYLRALLEGLFPGPQRSDELRDRLRARAASKGSSHLHRLLSRLDPAAALKIHANDIPKLIRAIEVCLSSRQAMTELWKQGRDPLQGFDICRVGLDPAREALYARINLRAERMFERGLIDETAMHLRHYGGPEGAPALGSLGYKQAMTFLSGAMTMPQAVAAAQQGHRNYAKRQMTWFRREPGVHWLTGFGDDTVIQEQAFARISHEFPQPAEAARSRT